MRTGNFAEPESTSASDSCRTAQTTDIEDADKAQRSTEDRRTSTWKTVPKTNEIDSGAALLTGAAGVNYDYQKVIRGPSTRSTIGTRAGAVAPRFMHIEKMGQRHGGTCTVHLI